MLPTVQSYRGSAHPLSCALRDSDDRHLPPGLGAPFRDQQLHGPRQARFPINTLGVRAVFLAPNGSSTPLDQTARHIVEVFLYPREGQTSRERPISRPFPNNGVATAPDPSDESPSAPRTAGRRPVCVLRQPPTTGLLCEVPRATGSHHRRPVYLMDVLLRVRVSPSDYLLLGPPIDRGRPGVGTPTGPF